MFKRFLSLLNQQLHEAEGLQWKWFGRITICSICDKQINYLPYISTLAQKLVVQTDPKLR